MKKLIALALEAEFTRAAPLDPAELTFLPEVRAMCAADRCHQYGKTWCCPPGCGTLEEIAARAGQYTQGVLVQSTGALEDDFDVEAMLALERLHKVRFAALTAAARRLAPDCLPMGAGGCALCAVCTYPSAPCRRPEAAAPSMEAYGLLVSQVCTAAGLGYYYGPRTMTYTSCILTK